MTNKEKQLLLIDLCARLPYGVEMLHSEEFPEWFSKIYGKGTSLVTFTLSPCILEYTITELDRVKPYLRSISNMTEEEAKEFYNLPFCDEQGYQRTDWLNAHHFDYRGLIPMGLALEAKEGMYKNK